MSKKLYEKLLIALNRANKIRKEKLADEAGYATVEQYRAYLQARLKGEPEEEATEENTPVSKPIIHVVDIIDCSYSMVGAKIANAIHGINAGVEELKKDDSVTYLYTLCDFSSYNDIKFKHTQQAIEQIPKINFHARNQTALFDAIGKSLETMRPVLNRGEKVLVNIYTDGGENNSKLYRKDSLSALIKELETKGVTVTFIGTLTDVRAMVDNLNVEESNTMAYDGSADGLKKSMEMTRGARTEYSAKVAKGEDVSKGFYKNIN